MTYTAYIERQKTMIKNRREGELILFTRGEEREYSESDELFYQLISLKGLNTEERINARSGI